MSKICPNCGLPVAEDKAICPNCDAEVNASGWQVSADEPKPVLTASVLVLKIAMLTFPLWGVVVWSLLFDGRPQKPWVESLMYIFGIFSCLPIFTSSQFSMWMKFFLLVIYYVIAALVASVCTILIVGMK